jgi:hypothetical protein
MVLEEKVMALVWLATDPGTSEQEQRTAAVAACRLIRENGLAVIKKIVAKPNSPPRTQPKPRKSNPHKKTIGDILLTTYIASRCGRCSVCKLGYEPWAALADVNGKAAHFTCAVLRAAS